MINWISVKDRLPEEGTLVLSYGKKDNILSFMYYWREDFLLSGARYTTKVTHWAGFNLPDEKPDACVWDMEPHRRLGTICRTDCDHFERVKKPGWHFCPYCGRKIEMKE
jgi:hypothetical protein